MEDNCYRGQATQAALKFFRKKKKKRKHRKERETNCAVELFNITVQAGRS